MTRLIEVDLEILIEEDESTSVSESSAAGLSSSTAGKSTGPETKTCPMEATGSHPGFSAPLSGYDTQLYTAGSSAFGIHVDPTITSTNNGSTYINASWPTNETYLIPPPPTTTVAPSGAVVPVLDLNVVLLVLFWWIRQIIQYFE